MKDYTIATIGSHSALDVCQGAKKEGFRTIVVAQKGRDKTYTQHYKTRPRGETEIGCVDKNMLVSKFVDIVEPKNIKILQDENAIFVPNRSFAVYLGYENIEKKFDIPVFGNRNLLRAEEREESKNQHYLMTKGGIKQPEKISSPQKIDRLVIVKAKEAARSYERAFFLAGSYDEYVEKSEVLIKEGKIKREDLKIATIEEFVVGAQFNFNFFYSPIEKELELLGIDTRRQTNLDGVLRLPAREQLSIKNLSVNNIEVGHIACTLRESLLENIFESAQKLVDICKKEFSPGIIGPFALQGAITNSGGKEEFFCFDISFRIPGSPGTAYTPYSGYLFGDSLSYGRRIAMEIKQGIKSKQLDKITT